MNASSAALPAGSPAALPADPKAALPPPLLQARGLTKRFGGLTAVGQVDLDLWPGRIHAVIGPNGAGKSTLTHLLSGDLLPTSGEITLLGHSVTHQPPEARARAGLGRSHQKTNIFAAFTVWDNVRLAAQALRRLAPWNPLHWLERASGHAATDTLCERALELAGLGARRGAIAGTISHGEQRQLEIAMTLATQPRVLLLDEPLAGMGAAEAERMIALLLALKAEHAMLLVEHDIDAIFALADHLTVMVNGQTIASDTPGRIRADSAVQAAYLGEEDPA